MIWDGELVVPGLPQHAHNSLGGKVSVASLLSHICPEQSSDISPESPGFSSFCLLTTYKIILALQIEEGDVVGAEEELKTGVRGNHCG